MRESRRQGREAVTTVSAETSNAQDITQHFEESDTQENNSENPQSVNSSTLTVGQESQSDQDETVESEENDPRKSGEKRKARKRTRDPETWIRNIRKRKRNAGQEYITRKGKSVSAKIFTDVDCKCKLLCRENISVGERRDIFDSFWKLQWETQEQTIVSSIKEFQKKSTKNPINANQRRQNSRHYYLNNTKVCKNMYLQTLAISNRRADYALRHKKIPNTILVEPDKRTEHTPHNKTPISTVTNIKEHINKFPKYRSHYTQKVSKRYYLDPRLSVSTMYTMYKQECLESGTPYASEWVYREIFNTQFNLSFKTPQKDTCKTCDILKIQLEANVENEEETVSLQDQLNEHRQRAERIRNNLKESIKMSNKQTKVITFDLQKTLQLPFLRTNEAYYCRQLNLYNFGVHSYPEDTGVMHLWTENQGKRGSEEISSCLDEYFKENIDEHVTKIIAYSDACGGQNRNFNVARHMVYTVNTLKNVKEIEVNFMESGHSFLPNDTDFSHISDQIKRESVIYSPDQYAEIIKKCKKKNPFRVYKMGGKFKSFEDLSAIIINRQKSETHSKVKWMQIKQMKFERNSLKMQFTWATGETHTVDFCRNKRAVEPTIERVVDFQPKKLYTGGLQIKGAKFNDLTKKLLKYIPPIFQPFFTQLVSDGSDDTTLMHPDYIVDDIDSEEED